MEREKAIKQALKDFEKELKELDAWENSTMYTYMNFARKVIENLEK